MRECIMGIDFGTSKIAIVLIDLHSKEVMEISSKETNAYVDLQNPSKREQNLEMIRKVFYDCVQNLSGLGERDIASIGLTGQMHGILGLDSRGNPLTHLVTWQDERGQLKGKSGKTIIEEMSKKGGKRPISSGIGIVSLYDWIINEGYSNISKICTLADYFGAVLTGRILPELDFTMAHSIGCFDMQSKSWDFNYLKNLRIDKRHFPDVLPPTTILGKLKDERLINLLGKRDIPIAVPLGDNQASYLGSVKDYYSTVLINIGTGSQISYGVHEIDELRSLKIDGYDIVLRPFIEGRFLVSGSALSGGSVYRALRDFFERVGRELFGVEKADDLYERMGALVWEKENSEGLSIYPSFAGRRSNPEDRGRIEGIGLKNFTPSNLIYGTLWGMTSILKEMVDDSILEKRRYLIGSGNGLKRNRVLRRIVSSIFKKNIMIPLFDEEAGIGAALNGAVACGIFEDFNEAKEFIKYI